MAGALNKDDEEQLKKKKLNPEPKTDASKKRKATAPKQKVIDEEEEIAATPSTTDVEEILKVMTESLPVKLSPLGPHLTKLFQKEKESAKTKKAARPKKQRIITVTEVIEGTPPQASAPKAPAVESTTATEAAPSEATVAEAATAQAEAEAGPLVPIETKPAVSEDMAEQQTSDTGMAAGQDMIEKANLLLPKPHPKMLITLFDMLRGKNYPKRKS